MGKILVGKIPPGEFQITTPEEYNTKRKQLQAQGILPYKAIPKYLPTLEPTKLYQAQLLSPVELDLVENFSFAQISLSMTNSTTTFLIVVAFQIFSIHAFRVAKDTTYAFHPTSSSALTFSRVQATPVILNQMHQLQGNCSNLIGMFIGWHIVLENPTKKMLLMPIEP